MFAGLFVWLVCLLVCLLHWLPVFVLIACGGAWRKLGGSLAEASSWLAGWLACLVELDILRACTFVGLQVCLFIWLVGRLVFLCRLLGYWVVWAWAKCVESACVSFVRSSAALAEVCCRIPQLPVAFCLCCFVLFAPTKQRAERGRKSASCNKNEEAQNIATGCLV